MKKKERIITKIKMKYWQTTHKFGIEIPKSVEHALLIDQQMGTNYWCKAIKKEMKNRVNCPLPISYCLEVDVSPLLDSKLTTRFQKNQLSSGGFRIF